MSSESALLKIDRCMYEICTIYHTKPQCGNFKIFLSLRFYVKSKLGILEVQNLPFLDIQRLWILIFMNFCTFWRLKFTKWTKCTAPKMAKMADFALLESSKLISCKFWMIQKSWNFHCGSIEESKTFQSQLKFREINSWFDFSMNFIKYFIMEKPFTLKQ